VDVVRTCDIPIDELVGTATALIAKLEGNEDKNTLTYGGCTLKLHRVHLAMLAHAESCGGESSTRYTAAAIYACIVRDQDDPQTLDMLHELGKTWVSHLLFICKYQ
jgi:hypothetical protein